MLKSHLARNDESGLTACGLQNSKVLAYEEPVFKAESQKFQCAKCLKALTSATPKQDA
jgi:hypothetical protein